jgi:hypothetical protein
MRREGLLIGEVAAKSGVSRKALRLYEKAGILPPPRRTESGYRVYSSETLGLLAFVAQARRRARVTDVSEAGSVPFLTVANRADRPLLLLDGEELIGAMQNRILNTTVLMDAHTEVTIPVSCVISSDYFKCLSANEPRDVRVARHPRRLPPGASTLR